jgi:hypothetical protein
MKSSATCQKAHLFIVLAFLNIGHIFDLHAYCAGVRSSSRPSLVPARPLRHHGAAWQSSLVVNLSSAVSGHAPVVRAEACTTIVKKIFFSNFKIFIFESYGGCKGGCLVFWCGVLK